MLSLSSTYPLDMHLYRTAFFFVISQAVFASVTHAQNWEGSVELGWLKASGNTESESVNFGSKVQRLGEKWEHKVKASVFNSENEQVESANTVAAGFESRRLFSERSYAFLSANYLDDEFDGFTARKSASVGVGRKLYMDTPLKWEVGLGIGYLDTDEISQLSTIDGVGQRFLRDVSSTTIVGKSEILWQLTDNTRIEDDLSIEVGDDNTFVENRIALVVNMNARLSLKLELQTRHSTDPAPDLDKTDQISLVSLVYTL